ncbi:hypothetical protein GOV06_04875 [Candidatus Woesearchaeota archaeon]|nr:hypothetical protein [Candidatus Woesearchaeota archaeon]
MNKFKINKELCEFYGILIGDGCISRFQSQGKTHHAIRIDGNSITDHKYYTDHLRPLIWKIFQRKVMVKHRKVGNCIFLMFEYKDLALFLKKSFNYPFGKKGEITISKNLLTNKNFLFSILRGLFDTDGSLYFTKNNSEKRFYPIIEISTHSKALLKQLYSLFTELKFNVVISHFQDSIKLHGKENLIKFMRLIGSSHPDKISKFDFWKRFGYCPRIDELNFEARVKALNKGL